VNESDIVRENRAYEIYGCTSSVSDRLPGCVGPKVGPMSAVTNSPDKPHHAVSQSALLWPLKTERLPIKALYCMNFDLSPGQPGRDAPLLFSISLSHFA